MTIVGESVRFDILITSNTNNVAMLGLQHFIELNDCTQYSSESSKN